MSRPEGRDLTRKAEGDAKAMRRLASDPEIDDEAVGFHAQQAIEKWQAIALVDEVGKWATAHLRSAGG